MTALLRYDAACRALAEAKTIDEVSEWIDKAAAVREYTRRIKNRQLEIDAIEIRVRAKRRRGELLLQLREQGKLRDGRKKQSSEDDRLTLEDLGISKNESAEEQKIAAVDGNSFERLIARCRAYAEAHPEKHTFNILNPPAAPSATMHSRKEPDGSLDYSPTAPWGTRALIEQVMPRLGLQASFHSQVCWEPACGEGHMAEVLSEYFGQVIATDVHDYGYHDGEPVDFLNKDLRSIWADWIITNPPFNRAKEFAHLAIERARRGVALFVRWQWIEGVGRYNDLFSPYPPAIVGVFSERIPLHMGRWEPDGGTLTAYCWIVWLKGFRSHTRLFWIPPGQRKALTKADDVERFTQHPVQKKRHAVCDEPFDKDTGEIIDVPPVADDVEPVSTLEPASVDPETDAGSLSCHDLDIPPRLKRGDPECVFNGRTP